MSFIQFDQQQHNNNNNCYYWRLMALLDVNEDGRLVFPFSRRLVLIDRPVENDNENTNDEHHETSDDDNSYEDNESFVSISLPPTPFAYDPYDSYDWEC